MLSHLVSPGGGPGERRIMLSGTVGPSKQSSLMAEYSSLLTESVLRHKAWLAEHQAGIEQELASRVGSQFIANMSHELRAPLDRVIGFAKLIGEHRRRGLKEDEIVEYADLIRDAATHLLAIVDDILDISKMQAGKFTIDAREVALDEVLQAALASFEHAAREAGVGLACDMRPGLPAVEGDPARLRRIFGNLIGNAVRFTPPGGTVRLVAGPAEDGGAVVSVRDTGPGMNREDIVPALTPFAQVDSSRARRHDGTGLELPIAKALAQLHGGSLEIRSERSRGTEVTVRLPSRLQVPEVRARGGPDAILSGGIGRNPT
jgi:two-component system cell cycle sensor histidine kinase PleC